MFTSYVQSICLWDIFMSQKESTGLTTLSVILFSQIILDTQLIRVKLFYKGIVLYYTCGGGGNYSSYN